MPNRILAEIRFLETEQQQQTIKTLTNFGACSDLPVPLSSIFTPTFFTLSRASCISIPF